MSEDAVRRRRVLIVEPAGLLGGSEQALLDLLAHLDRTRFDITVVAPSNSSFLAKVRELGLRAVGAPIGLLHQRGLAARCRALASLMSIAIRLRPHVIHVNQAGLERLASMVSSLVRASVICHVRLLADARRIRGRHHRRYRRVQYVAVSSAVAVELLRNGVIAESRVECILDPLDQEVVYKCTDAQSIESVRSTFGVPDDAIVVSMVGRVCEDKRQELLIEAAVLLSRANVHYLIVGGDPPKDSLVHSYRERLMVRVRDANLATQVHFVGERVDAIAIMRASDVVVMASEEEALGRVLLEALSLGTPIVAPSAGGPAEIAGDDERGLTFVPGDAKALARSIEATIDDPYAARSRTSRGAEWVRLSCSPGRHARAIERVYEGGRANSGAA